jgi:phage shock protein E
VASGGQEPVGTFLMGHFCPKGTDVPLYFELKRSFNNKKDIRKEEINQYIKQGAVLIDVRSPQEYREGHLNGAISIPDYQIRRSITRQISNKEKLIVVYCSTGHRSQEAQRILENMGYTNVYNVYEGVLI